MHWHFENWNDIKHEPRKFWSAESTFFNLCKIIHIHDGESESQTPLLRLLGGGEGGRHYKRLSFNSRLSLKNVTSVVLCNVS